MYLLTPMDIHDHQFKKSFRGYSENEVDDFLDRVVDDFEKLLRDNERLKSQVYANDKELEHYRKLEKTLNDTLMVAQRTADEVITAAKKNAEDMKESAARECQQIQEQARLDAKKKIDSAITKRDAILAEYDKFVREKKAFLVKLRTILESELSITTQMIEDVPKVDELIKKMLTEETPAPVEETPAPVKEIPAPVKETPAPVKEIPAPDEDYLPNLVDVSTKPVVVKKSDVTDDTKTYSPVKIDKESSK